MTAKARGSRVALLWNIVVWGFVVVVGVGLLLRTGSPLSWILVAAALAALAVAVRKLRLDKRD